MNRIKRAIGLLLVAAMMFSVTVPMPLTMASDADFVIVGATLMEYRGNAADIVIPSNVNYIAQGVFRGKSSIRSVTFHDTVVGIGRFAFENCTGLTSVKIPNRVTRIESGTFNGCTGLASVTLHPYLVSIGGEAFQDCPITSLELPYSLTTLGMSAFRNNRLTSVHIPSVVTVIADFAFVSGQSITIRGAVGSRAESYANTFNHAFVATPDAPPPAPPVLPPLNIPPKTIQNDAGTALPRYDGPGQAPVSWAVQAVNYMYHNTTIEDEYFRDYAKGVTRVEAAYYMVHVYYAVIGSPLEVSPASPVFADTDSVYAAKARELGLMSGTDTEKNLFSPGTILTREQIATMLISLLDKAGVSYNKSNMDHITFADQGQISGWALPGLRRAYYLGLINGTTSATPPSVNPGGILDRQQLYQMLWSLLISLNKIENGYTRGSQVGTPQLVYTNVGRHPQGHIDEAYYAAPAVADIDKDGKPEIIYTAYSIYCVDAKTGSIKWQVPSGYDRRASAGTKPLGFSFSDIIVMDVDGDGELEIITGHQVSYDESGKELPAAQRKGVLAVYDKNGYFKPGWPKTLPRAINSVAAADLTGDGKANIVVGLIGETELDIIWAYDHAGNVMSGWPQLNNSTSAHKNTNRADNTGYTYGLQNNTIAIGDIDGSGHPSIIVPTDMRHIAAFDRLGNLIKGNPVFGGRSWGRIGTWLDYEYEKLVENEGFGFGNKVWSPELMKQVSIPWVDVPMEKRLFANFVQSPAVIVDVDGDGRNEVVIVGTVSDQAFQFPDPPLFEAPFIFNGDRTRFKTDKYDWTAVPTNAGPILTHEYRDIILARVLPVVADVNADGVNDILFNSMSGKVMCYSLDKSFMWSHWINNRDNHTIEIASPLAAYDLNNNGFKDIVFGTTTPFDSAQNGRLIILDFKGDRLQAIELPKALGASGRTNGVAARPVVVDLDGDGKPYIILSTYLSGLTVYKMP